MSKIKRRQLFVDKAIQGALMVRVSAYWVLCLVSMTLMLIVWQMLFNPTRLFWTRPAYLLLHYGPAVMIVTFLLPIAVFDILRLSNRFVGPFLRLRGAIRRLACGEPVEPIRFRKHDFWQEFAEEFNAVAARLEAMETALERERAAESKSQATTSGSMS